MSLHIHKYETNDKIKVLYVAFRISSPLKNSILLNLDPRPYYIKVYTIYIRLIVAAV